jgi:RNA polymerase sigma factor (sigma-70 family)
VLLKLAENMRVFAYDPSRSFRAWLKTVTHHAWCDYVERRRFAGRCGDQALEQLLESREAPDDLNTFLEAEHQQALLEQAMARVQLRVEARTWEAFRLQALEQRKAADVASKLAMPQSAVFMAKSRVQAMLRQEVRQLESEP